MNVDQNYIIPTNRKISIKKIFYLILRIMLNSKPYTFGSIYRKKTVYFQLAFFEFLGCVKLITIETPKVLARCGSDNKIRIIVREVAE